MNMTSCCTKKCTSQNGGLGQSEAVGGLTTIESGEVLQSSPGFQGPNPACQVVTGD